MGTDLHTNLDCSSVTDCTDDCCTKKQKKVGDTPLQCADRHWIAIFLQIIGGDIFLPSTCFCKDGDYLVRREYDFFDNNLIGVYKVNGLTEKRISFYSYSSPDSIKVYDSLNVIAFYCPSEIQEDPWPTDTIAPLRVIEQLRDNGIDSERRKKIEQLAHRLNARLGYTLAE